MKIRGLNARQRFQNEVQIQQQVFESNLNVFQQLDMKGLKLVMSRPMKHQSPPILRWFPMLIEVHDNHRSIEKKFDSVYYDATNSDW